ncbi:LuxR C-terminal-related transcriptional regulator, partial [Bacteroides caecimuris]|uniref:helix-turn-helix transcriptional regulator n=1 Tax=Bacteroides caecimuris TaxID=1796613 RepID=UPI00272D6338
VNLQLNAGNLDEAERYVDRIANLDIDKSDYDVVAGAYLNFLKIVINYERIGVLSSSRLSNVAHNLRKVSNNLEIKKQERDDALESAYDLSRKKYELTIRHQRLWLTLSIVILIAVIATTLIAYVSHKRRQRLIDAEERIETLEELVKSAQNVASEDKQGLLKKLLLQHLGIIKTFAESPTSQNQEALRKISSVGSPDSNRDSLIKWDDFYPIIDELFENFHSNLISQHPNLFSEREINILCLLRAGFSTKEIGVLVEQTSNSIYVSKTSIRKKLGVGVKEDIISYFTSKSAAAKMG